MNIQTGPFGSQLHQSDYSDEGTPVVMPKDIINGVVSEEDIARVSEDHVNRLARHKVESGDILYARRGDVGKCAFINAREKGWLCGTGCLKVSIDKTKANPKFVFFQLQKPTTIAWVKLHAKGATMPNLNTEILSEVPMDIPNLEEQNNIVYILSKYDSLIENYQQQIKLLEEAAQRLYKEWFVDLHFPGYENTKIVDGVPEGWEKGNLSSLAEFRRGKTIVKKEIVEGAIPVVAGGLGPAYYYTKSNTEDRVITVSASGANAGFTRLYYQKIWTSDCSYVDKSMTEHLYFVYCFLKSNKIVIDNLQKGATQPHVYSKDINALELILPSNKILSLFDAKVIPMFDKIGNLTTQIRLLTEARDRLLPKLMSGELEMYSKREMHRV